LEEKEKPYYFQCFFLTTFSVSSYSINVIIASGATSRKESRKRQKRMKGGQEKRRNVNALNDIKRNRKNGESSPLQSNKVRIDGSHTYPLQKKNPQG
jgi:hypothetical protein